ncbi:ABC transporter ATP-binding protein [Nocardioides campestrisoli]|uniref:ABC transporter ATP-binding protein n=1 Tax=Nocardioides campestrisoli TaxID=2736757 RepID=UPI0015E7802B|nr:ABC transporter ATP-binding protein [Nocardioides campestrisoli]
MDSISIAGVHKSFGNRRILEGVDLEVEQGEFVCLLGPSGCGKTTLLRCIAGLESPDSGSIRFGDDAVFDAVKQRNVPPERRQLGMVFQNFALWPHKTVWDNVAYPLQRRRTPRAEARDRIEEALDLVGLGDQRDSYPGTLSGGQQQRVSLARAVVARPRVLLFDEPLSSLDANLREQMRREIRRLQQHLGATAIYVTHDKEDAGGLADRLAVLQDGQVAQQGTPRDVFSQPSTRFVAQFVGFDHFLPGVVESAQDGGAVVALANGHRVAAPPSNALDAGADAVLAVRSRLLSVMREAAPGDNVVLDGAIDGVAYLGDDVEVTVRHSGGEMIARVSPAQARTLDPGSEVVVVANEGALSVLRFPGTTRHSAAPAADRVIGQPVESLVP